MPPTERTTPSTTSALRQSAALPSPQLLSLTPGCVRPLVGMPLPVIAEPDRQRPAWRPRAPSGTPAPPPRVAAASVRVVDAPATPAPAAATARRLPGTPRS